MSAADGRRFEQRVARLITQGRVTFSTVQPARVVASVQTGPRLFTVRLRDGSWSCSCPTDARCSHLEAVRRLVAHHASVSGATR